tara:strand:- start:1720 stop:2055 length:336 start_codon:yes stop_codon:yes gene_type:complete
MELGDRIKIAAVVGILAFLFSPGLLLTLPPKSMSQSGLLGFGILNSKETHILSMFVHGIVIAIVLLLLLTFAPVLKDICGPSESVEIVEEVEEEVEEVEGGVEAEVEGEGN